MIFIVSISFEIQTEKKLLDHGKNQKKKKQVEKESNK